MFMYCNFKLVGGVLEVQRPDLLELQFENGNETTEINLDFGQIVKYIFLKIISWIIISFQVSVRRALLS